jgi:hypothetical protein
MRRVSALGLCVVAALGTGCVMMNAVGGNEVPEERVAQIRPGETTRADILDWFGSPAAFTDPSGLRLLFEAAEVRPEDVLSFPYADVLVFQLTRAKARALLLVLFNYVEVHGASDRLVVFFDDQDRVMYYGYSRGADAL